MPRDEYLEWVQSEVAKRDASLSAEADATMRVKNPRRREAGLRAQAQGATWESQIERRLHVLQKDGRACWFRTPEPLRRIRPTVPSKGLWECVATREGPPDFCVISGGHVVLLEAKQTIQPRWHLDQLKRHQAEYLDQVELHGGFGAIALRLEQVPLVVPWAGLGPAWWAHERGEAQRGGASLDAEGLDRCGAITLDWDGRWLVQLCHRRTT
jgi:hypothetical protein